MPVPTRQADLAWMLEHSPGSVIVTLGGASTWGRLRLAGREELEAGGIAVSTNAAMILIKIGTLPGLADGVLLTATGVGNYRVHQHHPESDGALTRIVCVPA